MKLGRNDPCPCGSHKKYKNCCLNEEFKPYTDVLDEVKNLATLHPNLSIDELNVITGHKMEAYNNRPLDEFCGLSPNQMANWLDAPIDQLKYVTVSTPNDLSRSPVMRYLTLILDLAMANGGGFAATSKGNLPAKLAKQASDLLPEFAVAKYEKVVSINDYAGSNEDKINALHYTRVLAELTGIIHRRSGQYRVKKSWQKLYQSQGIQAFYKPMLQTAATGYNWGYLDGYLTEVNIQMYWLFMVWRLQSHASVDQLADELIQIHPDPSLGSDEGMYLATLAHRLVEIRFIKRFLEYWGLITINPVRYNDGERLPRKVEIQPLFRQTFRFDMDT